MRFHDHEHVVECIQWAPDKTLRYVAEAEQDHVCRFLFLIYITPIFPYVSPFSLILNIERYS